MIKNKKTARPGDKNRFEQEKIIVARMGKEVAADYDDKGYYVKDGMLLLKKSNETNLKYLLGVLNSKLINYYYKNYFITVDVLKNALLELPVVVYKKEKCITELVDQMLCLQKQLHEKNLSGNEKERLEQQIKNIDYEIDQEVYKLYGLTKEEIKIVEESLR